MVNDMDAAIAAITAAGFSVYMRNPTDTYLFFTDEIRIGYLQVDRLVGFSISTVHVPNAQYGTGFRIRQHLAATDLTPAALKEAFVLTPWPLGAHTLRKWTNFSAFRNANTFNRGYTLVAAPKAERVAK